MIRRLLFHNFRVVHALSNLVRNRFTPAGLLLLGGAVSSGIFGVDTRQSLAFQIFALTAGVLLVGIAGGIMFRGDMRMRRMLPRFGTVGVPLHYKVALANEGNRMQRELLLADELDSKFPAFDEFLHERDPQDRRRNWFDRRVGYPRLMGMLRRRRGGWIAPVPVPDIAAHDAAEVGLQLKPLRRGYLHFRGLRLARPDPLGLFQAILRRPQRDSLLVLPRLYRVSPIRLRGRRRYQQGGMQLASLVGDSQEFLTLRDYKPGDPLRSIHWRSYAKTGTPVVKEFQDEFFVRQGLVLDTFAGEAREQIFEEAVSVAASFVRAQEDQDSLLDLMFVGTEAYRFTAGRGLAGPENMLEILACVGPCPDGDFAQLARLVRMHLATTSGLICVFLDWDESRRTLVRELWAAGTAVIAFVITDDPERIAGDALVQSGHVAILDPNRVQDGLDAFFTRSTTV